ncbi:hypothetical protein IEQ34_020412 [Dendrobium chrysotoxum]|uniref:IBH1-like N-terminal domain-containing protein n=1 Tax=Dendrobium chrysotoxum TaxID=161865 RepID=A0AAV7G1Y7_DENCH|nr:hypothetical protein IEQ34_020412 [Dendrobium chrysotoxum]
MSLNEREREIKHLADAAMALARGDGANWSRAVIAGLAKKENNEAFIGKKLCKEFESIASPHGYHGTSSFLQRKLIMKRKSFNSRLKIRKKGFHSPSSSRVIPSVLARRIVRKRTQVLKRIIPGAESLDGISLLSETLDYVVYLRAQANIMQRLTRVFGTTMCSHCKERIDFYECMVANERSVKSERFALWKLEMG